MNTMNLPPDSVNLDTTTKTLDTSHVAYPTSWGNFCPELCIYIIS